ncbi:MAG: hypothetical protein M5U34_44550 [Chloroflexi bacterium]|nr:hypothetical protein [Chloroflexota bacterium]
MEKLNKIVEAVVEKTVGRFLPEVEAKASGCHWDYGCCEGDPNYLPIKFVIHYPISVILLALVLAQHNMYQNSLAKVLEVFILSRQAVYPLSDVQ